MLPQVWKIPVNSQRAPDFVDSPNARSSFEKHKADRAKAFCFENGWIGIGWELAGVECNTRNFDAYVHAFHRQNVYSPKALHQISAFANRMLSGDFVWCREREDIYWLGRVMGEWIYKNEGDFSHYDLFQVRKCVWKRVGTADNAPGSIRNAFAGRGKTVSRIHASGAAVPETAYVWEKLSGEYVDIGPRPLTETQNLLGRIAHDDLEDIVALYLQIELGWLVVPSTAKHSTPTTEFVLRNRSGARAYLQVKAGSRRIGLNEINRPVGVDIFYYFYPTLKISDDEKEQTLHVRPLRHTEIIEFVKRNLGLMPPLVQRIFESSEC